MLKIGPDPIMKLITPEEFVDHPVIRIELDPLIYHNFRVIAKLCELNSISGLAKEVLENKLEDLTRTLLEEFVLHY